MAEFEIVDLTVGADGDGARPPSAAGSSVSGQTGGQSLGQVDTSVVANELESLRADLAAHIKSNDKGLQLKEVTVKLSVSASGKVAFVAKGSLDASIEIKFKSAD